MKKTNSIPTKTLTSISNQDRIKGGLLVYCEEKRVRLFYGPEVTFMQWVVVDDGSPLITMR